MITRVGIGYDIHRLEAGRALMLGGVPIKHELGLAGHSDADVVLHAVIDALLGAAGLPDIGELFPDTDEAYRNADSKVLTRDVMQRVRDRGYFVGNVDLIIHAESPNLSTHKRPIAESIAALVDVAADRVSVKAKTNEGLGPLGQVFGMACTAVILLTDISEAS